MINVHSEQSEQHSLWIRVAIIALPAKQVGWVEQSTIIGLQCVALWFDRDMYSSSEIREAQAQALQISDIRYYFKEGQISSGDLPICSFYQPFLSTCY